MMIISLISCCKHLKENSMQLQRLKKTVEEMKEV